MFEVDYESINIIDVDRLVAGFQFSKKAMGRTVVEETIGRKGDGVDISHR